jgi:asparagine synthase (glutamine-hydrolysing)
MGASLSHRGPDDSGQWSHPEAGIGLAFRRLAILDLSPAGHQPMMSASGRYVIVFNGEVYNFTALRRQLQANDPTLTFRGRSDTEVMLAAIEAWGLEGAVERFLGMFAFALWDRTERRLHLVRDRLGVKPLYYAWTRDTFLFGSELKALRAFPAFRPEIDRGALALLMRHNYIPAPYTIFKGCYKVPPATILTVRAGQIAPPAATPYWSAKAVAERGVAEPFRGSSAEAADQLDALLRDAVQLRMVADVPLRGFLSGGIDSSLVVALMQAQSSRQVKTFPSGSPRMPTTKLTTPGQSLSIWGRTTRSSTSPPKKRLR